MSVQMLFYLLAIIFWALGAFNVPRANWLCAGLAAAGIAAWLL